MSAYFDTSALLKLALDEDGSAVASEIWDATSRRLASTLAYPEACAGLSLARRLGRLPSGDDSSDVAVDVVADALTTVSCDDDLARRAGRLVRAHALRGADAVHLATACEALEAGGLLVTWDARLARAARAEGLTVLP